MTRQSIERWYCEELEGVADVIGPPVARSRLRNCYAAFFLVRRTAAEVLTKGGAQPIVCGEAKLRRFRDSGFACKGPGTKGILTPARMGQNGDQIPRLFTTAADVFLVQYWAR